MTAAALWLELLAGFAPAFTSPSLQLFIRMATGWVLCPGRRTITRMYQLAEPQGGRAHDAYHRFFRVGAWSMSVLWKLLAQMLVPRLYPSGAIPLDLDDTAFHKSGRKVEGAAWWRDAVRSTGQKVVHCFGLNLVVLTLRVYPPWGGEPLGLPVNMRVHRKGDKTLLELAQLMLLDMAEWLPGRIFALCADGFYAPLAGELPQPFHLTSRMRRDAALYAPPPKKRKRGKGRPRKKGRRLPTPQQMAKTNKQWDRVSVNIRGKTTTRLVTTRDVLWYKVRPGQLVRLVICRDPDGIEPDDFFFTTNLQATAVEVIEQYAGRWSIEDTFKNVKQLLAGHTPQSWKHNGPERTAAFSLWLYSVVWFWHLTSQCHTKSWISLPWYRNKTTPSFADALACLRRDLWRKRIFSTSEKPSLGAKNIESLINVLAYAA
ncbi:MAG: transposase [Planctomycetota bacterium]|nr:transposase [Planctomycetota bacterium]